MKNAKLLITAALIALMAAASGLGAEAAGKPAPAGVVNINTADAAGLAQLPGIGMKKAGLIIACREAHESFKTVEELMKVKGIGEKTFRKLEAHITIGTAGPAAGSAAQTEVKQN